MKNFRTTVTPEKPPFTISHNDRLVSIGSCFSENIGRKFRDYKFNININPFGQQYNPYSIAHAIHRLLQANAYTENDLVYHDELFHSFDHHGSFSRHSVNETLEVINTNLLLAANDLKHATVLFLTFGTSHVFELNSNHHIVSNCHKLSGNMFTKRLMSPAEIVAVLNDALAVLHKVNPSLKVILTVSPVRYFAFGAHENTVSKAHLFSALHELMQQHTNYYYFPAYEIVMDDLRDYRFFAEDMLHPNYQATDYVWEQLCNTMLNSATQTIMRETNEILLAAKHKPRNPNSEAHKKFIQKYLNLAGRLTKDYQLKFEEEETLLRRYL